MGDETEEEEELLQLVSGELKAFGTKNERRFRIIEDLTLSLDVVKTPEAKKSIREMTDAYFKELAAESASTNARIQKMLNSKPALKKKGASPDFGKKIKGTIDRLTSVSVGKGKLKLKVKDFKKLPQLQYELKF